MTGLKVALVITGNGKQAQQALNDTAKAERGIGQAATWSAKEIKQASALAATAGRNVKDAAVQQSQAIRAGAQANREALDAVKRASTDATAALRRGMRDAVTEERRATEGAAALAEGLRLVPREASNVAASIKRMATGMRGELERVKGVMGSVTGKIGLLGVGFGAVHVMHESADLDRTELRIGQRSSMDPKQMAAVRTDAFQLARDSGVDVEQVIGAREILGKAGLSDEASAASWKTAVHVAQVSNVDPETIARLGAASSDAFHVDLAQKGNADKLFGALYASTRFGHADMQGLGGVMQYGAPAAMQARWNLPTFLGMAQALSPMRASDPSGGSLGTLMTQLMEPWSRPNYMAHIGQRTGLHFLDKQGSLRDPLDVLGDLGGQLRSKSTDADRLKWMLKVFGTRSGINQETVQALMVGTSEESLVKARSARDAVKQQFDKPTQLDAAYVQTRDLPSSVAGRAKATMREFTDRMAEPINRALAEGGKYLLDDMHLSGGQMLGGAAALGVTGYYGGRLAKWAGGKGSNALLNLLGGQADTAKNIVVGRALQESTGVTPVFVTNWAGAPSAAASSGPSLPAVLPVARPTTVAGFVTRWLGGLAAAASLPAAGAGGIYAMYQTSKDLPQATVAAQDDAAARRWQAGGRYDTLQPKAETKRLTESDVSTRRDIMAKTPYGEWWNQHRSSYSWYENARPIDDYRTWVAQQADSQRPSTDKVAAEQLDPSKAMARRLAPNDANATLDWVRGLAAQVDTGNATNASAPANAQATKQLQEAAQVFSQAARLFEQLLGKPLQIEVISDTPELHAKVIQRVVRDARRG